MTPAAQRLRHVADLARAISSGLEPSQVLEQVTKALEALRPRCVVVIRLVDHTAGGYALAASRGAAVGAATSVVPFGSGLTHVIAETRRPLLVEDVGADARVTTWVNPECPVYYGVPIIAGNSSLGVIELSFAAGDGPSAEERDVVDLLAGQAAVAIGSATLLAKSETRRRAADALADVCRVLSRTLDPDAVARQVAESLQRLLGAQMAVIHRYEPDSGDLASMAWTGEAGAGAPDTVRFPRGTGLVGLAVRDRCPVSSPNVLHDPRITLLPESRELIAAAPFRAGLAVPLFAQDHVIGVLAVGDREGRIFDVDDVALAQAFADQAAVALENARLFALERSRAEHLEALAEIQRELVSTLSSDHVLRLIVERAARLFDAVGGIYLVEGDRLVPRAWTEHGPFEHVVRRLGEGLVGRCAEARRGIVLDDYQTWAGRIPEFVTLGVRRSMAHPLIVRDRLLGVIAMNRLGERAPAFRGDDLAMLERCATLAAVALQNVMLYEQAQRRRLEAEALARVARTLTETLDVSAVGDRVVDSVVALFGAQSSALQLLAADGALVLLALGGRARAHFGRGHTLSTATSLSGRALREGRPVWTADALTDPALLLPDDVRRGMQSVGDAAMLAVPLRAHDRVVGALVITDRAGRAYTDDEAALLQAFADQAALALENARLYARLEERAQKLTALALLTRLITAAQDTPEVFAAVVRSATTLLGARAARVWVQDAAAAGLRVAASYAVDADVEQSMSGYVLIPYGQGHVGRIFQLRTPSYVVDIADDIRWFNHRLAVDGRVHAFAGLPLVAGDRVVGVLSILFGETRAFTAEEKELMGCLADQAAITITNARLFEGQQARAARLRALATVTRVVSSSLDMGEVLGTIARAAADLMAVPLVVIWTADEARRTLEVRAFSDDTLGADFPVRRQRYDEGGVGWVATQRAPLDVADVSTDDRVVTRAWFAAHQLRSALVVPIVFGDALLGVLSLVARAPLQFGGDERDLLDAFVAQAAVAIRNARLYEDLRRANERLEQSQAQLVRAERLGALGEMAAGVAHDFNNLLAVILGRSELLLRRVADPMLRSWVEAVRQAARDGADTVRRIQEFTRTRTTRSFGRVELGAVLREVVELTRPRWKDEAQSRGVPYDVRVVGEAPPVAGRPEELREVFANMLNNALDAMPDGGRCLLRLGTSAGLVEVAVIDTGVGMRDDVRQRVFEPFFTTKGQRGNGLGLAVAWGIVSRHGGTIDVDSVPGEGSTFTVKLPIGRDFAAAQDEERPVAGQSRAARILVVDDEPAVRLVLATLLAEEGHEVVQADSGAEALARCADTRFDLVLSDLSMPRMSGWEFAAACRERFPDLPVGLITGWGDQLDPHLLQRHHVRFVLAKPFEAKEVTRQIAQVLT